MKEATWVMSAYSTSKVETVLLVPFAPVCRDLRDSPVDRILDFLHPHDFGFELNVFGGKRRDFGVVLQELFCLLRKADQLAGFFDLGEEDVFIVQVLEGPDESGPPGIVLCDCADVGSCQAELVEVVDSAFVHRILLVFRQQVLEHASGAWADHLDLRRNDIVFLCELLLHCRFFLFGLLVGEDFFLRRLRFDLLRFLVFVF